MSRVKFSWVAHWREKYALGEIDIEEFERLVASAVRAEALPSQPARARTAKDCAEAWSGAASRAAANYSAGVAALSSISSSH